ncbi:mRNA capping enzyme, catalytic domain-containing protein [Cladorrhinum samala]|uniref:mRNA-capping enzyme subunit alpha n=1 Tax=Cladorrhinum samala TaxID=585594 RepID=A0AAV9HC34_9PEZI|nr:mRNA capping enzyme, catalytic domain-containing protein [Cladorrhinum samala]
MDPNSRPLHDIANPGIKAEHELAKSLRGEVARLLGRSQFNFPGAQPVSFSRKHIDELRREDYYVCEKSDGIRYLLYLTQDENGRECQYLIDRKNDYWFLHMRNMHFPLPGNTEKYHVDTLIDGELVMDSLPGGKTEPKFLVFDLLALDGKADLLAKPLDKRLGYFKEHVMKPYRQLFADYPDEAKYMAFKVEMKEMQFSYGIEMMFRQVLPSLKHQNDGLIFTCRTSPYQFGTDQHILKWKAPHDNTVDFRLKLEFPRVEPNEAERAEGQHEPFVDYDSVPKAKLLIFLGNDRGQANYEEFQDPLYLTEDEWEQLKSWGDPLQGRIIECCLDEEKRWRLYRFRDDKSEANHVSTVMSVLDSIKDGVSEDELLGAAKSIKDEWKSRERQRH